MKPSLEITLPVYQGNLHDVEVNLPVLVDYCRRDLAGYDWRIVLAVNGSGCEDLIRSAVRIQSLEPGIFFETTPVEGKGSGIYTAWTRSRAEIVSYMDIDLSTDLSQFMELIRVVENGAHLAVGSRFHPDSRVRRTWLRRFISFGYHRIFLPVFMGVTEYTDAQCGFKAARREAVCHLLPAVRNRNWFFDSELLYIASRRGYRIREIPVQYSEVPMSGVKLGQAVLEFLRGSWELRRRCR